MISRRETIDAQNAIIREKFVEQAHLVPEAWLFASEQPDIWIDIATTLPQKILAGQTHASQQSDPAELERNWYRRAAIVGESAGLSAAEAFKRVDLG
jgi:LmbE family N-acetylglucosaminyl deacetylase